MIKLLMLLGALLGIFGLALYGVFTFLGIWAALAGAALTVVLVVFGIRKLVKRLGGIVPRELTSMVLLLREPRLLNKDEIHYAAGRAWGDDELEVIPFSIDAEEEKQAVEEAQQEGLDIRKMPVAFGIRKKNLLFSVACPDHPYCDKKDSGIAVDADDPGTRAFLQHEGTIMVDLHESDDPPSDKAALDMIGKLIAELADARVVALYTPTYDQLVPWTPDVPGKLRGANAMDAFGEGPFVRKSEGIRHIANDDPRMKKAVEEARNRFPEFADAFRQPHGEKVFLVKAPFTDKHGNEFMWVRVAGIGDDHIEGLLVNSPATVRSVKGGDHVRVELGNLNDWAIIDGDDRLGAFTEQVLLGRNA